MNLFTWSVETLQYAEEMIAGATLLLGAAGILLGKARILKNQLLEVIGKSKPANEHFAKTAMDEGFKAAEKEIKRKLLK